LDLVDNPEKNEYPLPLYAAEKYNCQVGRIRQDCAFDNVWRSGFPETSSKRRRAQCRADRRRVVEIGPHPLENHFSPPILNKFQPARREHDHARNSQPWRQRWMFVAPYFRA